jgi:hypothetical protein
VAVRLLLLLALLASASICAARDFDAAADNLRDMSDRHGNYISVSNRTVGNSSLVRLMNLNRYGNANWDVNHSNGALQRASTFFVDGDGAPVVAGARLHQGVNHVWVMKYSNNGQFLWENVDAVPGCEAFAVTSNKNGDFWIAASCIDGQNTPVRLLHYSSAGNLLWAQNYSEGGRNYVRNLNLDFLSRASLTIQFDNGYGRTLVYDAYGNRLTTY